MKVDLVLLATNEVENQEQFKSNLLKYIFKSIDTNLDWINHVYYIINDDTNILCGLNLNKITLVPRQSLVSDLPKEIVDNIDFEFLLIQLLELSNDFIVMKDNTFITNPLSLEDFFDPLTEKPIYSTTLITSKEPFKRVQEIVSNYTIIFSEKHVPPMIKKITYGVQPFSKELLSKTIWEVFKGKYDQKITTEAAYYFGIQKNLVKESYNIEEGLFSYSSAWAGIIKYDLINNKKRQILSITNELNYSYNLIQSLHKTAYKWILEGLESRFGDQNSSYINE